MTNAAAFEEKAELLRTLGHGVRLLLLSSLTGGERSVGDMEAQTGVGQPTLSQQLGILRKAGLVSTRRDAKLVYYSIDRTRIAEITTLLASFTGPAAAPPTTPHTHFTEGGTAATFARIAWPA
ncbi:MAG TPA: metalloregulator ArsR/SmtB family transcription factor [Rhodopila sp.]|nr:metalloregulator ArsR/SmtB family transcription factor [Rhodopila sp.]